MPHTTTRSFVPADLNPADWSQIEPLFQNLVDHDVATPDQLARFLAHYAELSAVLSEFGSRLRIDQACHTDDPDIEKRFLHFIENIAPKIKPYSFQLQKKFIESPALPAIQSDRAYAILIREWQADIDLFRNENIPLQTDITKKVSQYDKLIGAMQVDFQGKSYTLQQLARFLEENDRPTREQTWTLAADRRLEDRDKIDDIFTDLLNIRQQIASNAGLDDYRAYAWKSFNRFDYQPQDCHDFANAIESVVVPLVEKLDQQRLVDMALDTLRPWDTAVDTRSRDPLYPFPEDDVKTLVEKTTAIFRRIDPALAQDFATLTFGKNFDLDSRKGKRAGGFQAALAEAREPFIFMNAAGLQRDVETLLHEGGHAFHFIWSSHAHDLLFFWGAPMEFCEVASMSMELFAADHFDVFYDNAQSVARAKRKLYEGIVRVLPWIATIDQFQHWLYTHPDHTSQQRTDAWLNVYHRFASPVVDWTGHEQARAALWQKQLHLFHHPFYYIEYGIAQLGALQLWQNFRHDKSAALAGYRAALALGNTRSLPDLFQAAGIRFDFSTQTLRPLIDSLATELQTLPA